MVFLFLLFDLDWVLPQAGPPRAVRLALHFICAYQLTALNVGSLLRTNIQQTRGVFFIGCVWCTVIELLQQHRKEVISIKDQLRFMKERLALNYFVQRIKVYEHIERHGLKLKLKQILNMVLYLEII